MPTYTQREVDKMMQKRDDEEAARAIASGRPVIMSPVSDDRYGLTKHSEFSVTVHDAPSAKRKRTFTGEKRRHRSHCQFPEGCVMCTLP
ncbi:MAG: hypothetical protein RIT04_170 [Candidatus Parcubacteria bacterium]|jgi:hypothetical protein